MNNLFKIRSIGKKMSIAELSRISGVSTKTIVAIEHDELAAGEGIRDRLSDALDVDPDNLFPPADPGPVPAIERQYCYARPHRIRLDAHFDVACPHCFSNIPVTAELNIYRKEDLAKLFPEIRCAYCGNDFLVKF